MDTDQWILAAKNAGAKFAILTATHETGFALYQSDVSRYSMKALKWEIENDYYRFFYRTQIYYYIVQCSFLQKIRLHIKESAAQPLVKTFVVY